MSSRKSSRAEYVVERLVARLRRVERDGELLLDPLLPDELGQASWTQRLLEVFFLGDDRRCQELSGHV
jgi:hypothetical protein